MSDGQEEIVRLTYEERALAKRAAEKKAKGPDDVDADLNINSMMDMMVIILCFLLFNIGGDPLAITQNDDLRLPVSMAPMNPEATLSIIVSTKQIVVDDRPVLTLNDGKVSDADLPGHDARIVPQLQHVIEQKMQSQAQFNAQLNRESAKVATMLVDGHIPYRTITRVMASAQAAGIGDLRFAVQRFDAANTYGGEGLKRVP